MAYKQTVHQFIFFCFWAFVSKKGENVIYLLPCANLHFVIRLLITLALVVESATSPCSVMPPALPSPI